MNSVEKLYIYILYVCILYGGRDFHRNGQGSRQMAASEGARVGFVNGFAGTLDGRGRLGRPAVHAIFRQKAFRGKSSRD